MKFICWLMLCVFSFACLAQESEILLKNDWTPEAAKGPHTVEKVANGVKIIMQHRDNFYGNIRVNLAKPLNLKQYNTVRIHFELPGEDNPLIGKFDLRLFCKSGGMGIYKEGWKQVTKQPDGSYVFEWDVVNYPPNNLGLKLEDTIRIAIHPPFSALPKDKDTVMIIRDIRVISGKSVETGDPELYAQWKAKISAYKPDYSDSSKYLLPPENGRLAKPLELVKNGVVKGGIVLAKNASEAEKLAAQELQLWIGKITGAKIGITENTMSEGIAIVLKVQPDSRIDGTDGYVVATQGNRITISGATPRGVVNGAYAFLENNSDLIFARPHPDLGFVYSKSPDFLIHWGNGFEKPLGQYFGWLSNWGGGSYFQEDYIMRSRNNYCATLGGQYGNRTEFGGGHNLQHFVPKDDPAFFPVVDGKKPDKLNIWKHQICMSAPNLVKVYADNVIKYFDAKAPENTTIVNINIEDNWGVCECDKCTAPIKLEDGRVLTVKDPNFRSTQFYIFLNAVTGEIIKVHPKLWIQTHAYFFSAVPPAMKVHERIFIFFCPYVRADHRTPLCSPYNDIWWQRFVGWEEVTRNLVIREYYGIVNYGRPLAEVVAFDLASYYRRGTRSTAPELTTDGAAWHWDDHVRGSIDEWDLNMMDFWIINRLYWNPEQDVEQLRKYFLRRVFRESAPAMERFWGIIREAYYKQEEQSCWGDFGKMIKDTKRIPELKRALDEAAQAAKHPVSALLVARVRNQFDKMDEKVVEIKRTPETSFVYGWRANRKFLNSYASSILDNGKAIDAVHIIARKKEGEMRYVCNFPYSLKDKCISFVLRPISALPVLPQISFEAGKIIRAPESCWQKNDDGTWTFTWTPVTSEDVTSKAMQLHYPLEKLGPEDEVEFYLTDFKYY